MYFAMDGMLGIPCWSQEATFCTLTSLKDSHTQSQYRFTHKEKLHVVALGCGTLLIPAPCHTLLAQWAQCRVCKEEKSLQLPRRGQLSSATRQRPVILSARATWWWMRVLHCLLDTRSKDAKLACFTDSVPVRKSRILLLCSASGTVWKGRK